jgi:hypothetical protein
VVLDSRVSTFWVPTCSGRTSWTGVVVSRQSPSHHLEASWPAIYPVVSARERACRVGKLEKWRLDASLSLFSLR